MIIYNITVKVEKNSVTEWVKWQQGEHIPEIMQTNLFTEYRFCRLLEQDDSEGNTYIVQFITDDMQKYKDYIAQHAPLLREKALARWGEKFIAFRTLMEDVQ